MKSYFIFFVENNNSISMLQFVDLTFQVFELNKREIIIFKEKRICWQNLHDQSTLPKNLYMRRDRHDKEL